MAEYIKISDYCKLSILSKSKVYRAINSGAIVTKKIDGVQYIDVESLPEEYKLPEKHSVAKKVIPQNTLIELSKNSEPEIIAVENSQPKETQVNNSATIELVKSFYDNLEQRTQYTISMQEETINHYKSELAKRNDQIESLMALLKEKETNQNTLAISTETTKDVAIAKLEKDKVEQQFTILNLEKTVLELKAKLNEIAEESQSKQLLQDSEAILQSQEAQILILEKQNKKYVDRISELEDYLKNKINEIDSDIASLENQQDQEDLTNIQSQLTEKEAQVELLKKNELSLNDKLAELTLQIESLKSKATIEDQVIITELKEKDEYLDALEKAKSDLEHRMSEILSASDETSLEISGLKSKLNESLEIITEYQSREKEYINILSNESNKINYIGTEVSDRKSYVETITSSRNELSMRIEEIKEASDLTSKEVQEIKSKLDQSYANIAEAKYGELEMESTVCEEISQVESIKTELGDRDTYYDNLLSSKAELDERLQEINDAITETTNEIANLSNQMQEVSLLDNPATIENIKKELADREDYLSTLQKSKQELEERIVDIHSESQDNSQELKDLRYKLKDSLEKIVNFELKEQEFEKAIKEEAEEINQLKQEILDRDLYLKDLEASKKELEERLGELSNSSDEISNELDSLKEKYEESTEIIETYKNKEKTASCILEGENSRIEELQKELKDRDSYLEALENSKNDLNSQINDLLSESSKTESELKSLQDKLAESIEVIANYQRDEKVRENALAEKNQQLEWLESKLNESIKTISDLEKNEHSNKEDFAQKVNELEILQKTNQNLEIKFNEAQDIIKEYENSNDKSEKLLEDDDDQIEALEEELFDKEHKISELELELCIKEDNINFYKNEVEQLKQQISSMEQNINMKEGDSDKPISTSNNDLSEKDNQIKTLSLEKDQLSALINNLEKDLAFYKRLDLSGENLSIDTQQRLAMLLNEADERQKIIIKQDMIIKERNNLIKDKDSIVKERQDRIVDLEKFLAKKQGLQENLEKEISELKAKNLNLSNQIKPAVYNNLDEEITRLKNVIEEKNTLIEQLQKNIQSLESINNDLNNKLNNVTVDDSINSTRELNNKLNDLFDQIAQKDQQITELNNELKDKDEVITSLQAGPESQLISFEDEDEYENQDLVSSLEEQINNLLEENALKDQQIEQLQALTSNQNNTSSPPTGENILSGITLPTSSIADSNLSGLSDLEDNAKLQQELLDLKAQLSQKEEELRIERQKFINCAISRSPQSIQIMSTQEETKEFQEYSAEETSGNKEDADKPNDNKSDWMKKL